MKTMNSTKKELKMLYKIGFRDYMNPLFRKGHLETNRFGQIQDDINCFKARKTMLLGKRKREYI